MKAKATTTKISQGNLDRIQRLKTTGYEPNDYILGLALDALEEMKGIPTPSLRQKPGMARTTKVSQETIQRIQGFKTTGYEPNDYIISLALGALEEKMKKKGVKHGK